MKSAHQNRLSQRMVRSMLALAIVSPVAAYGAPIIYTAGLLDSGAVFGTSTSHSTGYTSPVSTYTTSRDALQTGGVNNSVSTSLNMITPTGFIAGTSGQYLNATSATQVGADAWVYDPNSHTSTLLGLTSASYSGVTATTAGGHTGTPKFINDLGYVFGTSQEYGPANGLGRFSAWIATPAIGATPASQAHIQIPEPGGNVSYFNQNQANNGTVGPGTTPASLATYTENYVTNGMNTSGVVVGTAARYFYDGTAGDAGQIGQSAFVSGPNGVATVIGLSGSRYLSSDGFTTFSSVTGINNNGQVAGSSVYYNGAATSSTSSAWFYNPGTGITSLIGLTVDNTATGPAAINDPHYTSASVSYINNAVVVGSTSTTQSGSALWIYKIGTNTTVQLGLGASAPPLRGTYTGPNGAFNQSTSTFQNTNVLGQVAGTQTIYLGTTSGSSVGSDAFFYNGTTNTLIGLTDTNHTNTNAASTSTIRSNSVGTLNNSGQVDGTAFIFNGVPGVSANTNQGTDAWFYSAATGTVKIGLGDATVTSVYTQSTHNSSNTAINVNGQVVGTTTRYLSGTSSRGADAWVYTPGGTSVQVGLTGGNHQAVDAITQSTSSLLINNNASDALVAGISLTYPTTGTSSASNGNDAWLYDTGTTVTYPILSAPGFINPTGKLLTDSGILLGTYTDAAAHSQVFEYTISGGLVLLSPPDPSLGWQQLATIAGYDNLGDFIGQGLINGNSSAAQAAASNAVYVYNVPEPASLLLLSAGALALLNRRRRH